MQQETVTLVCKHTWGDCFYDFEDTIDETDWYPFPGEFYKDPLPQTPEEYLQYVDTVSDFLHKRNMRIAEWAAKKL